MCSVQECEVCTFVQCTCFVAQIGQHCRIAPLFPLKYILRYFPNELFMIFFHGSYSYYFVKLLIANLYTHKE